MTTPPVYRDIGHQTRYCLQIFRELLNRKDLPTRDSVNVTYMRFTEWCGSLAAHRSGLLSLDERLRDASRIRLLVLDCLRGIAQALNTVNGHYPALHDDAIDDVNSIQGQALNILISSSMVQDPIQHAKGMIDTLFRITIAVRQPRSVDRFANAQRLDLRDYRLFSEQDHMFLSTGKLNKMKQELRNRLVAASLQRRKFLQYTFDHQSKLAFGLDAMGAFSANPEAEGLEENIFEPGYEDTVASHRPQSVSISSMIGRRPADFIGESEPDGLSSITGSFGSDFGHEDRLRVPPFPEQNDNGLRRCPCCYLYLNVQTERSWGNHIITDLRPFVCTFAECAYDPGKLYSHKGAWFEHELTFHRRRWACLNNCSAVFGSRAKLRDHIHKGHPEIQDPNILEYLLAGKEILASTEDRCPFCSATLKSRKQTKDHIANHQKQIALMALYSMRIIPGDSDGELDDISDQDSVISEEPVPEAVDMAFPSKERTLSDQQILSEVGSQFVDPAIPTTMPVALASPSIVKGIDPQMKDSEGQQEVVQPPKDETFEAKSSLFERPSPSEYQDLVISTKDTQKPSGKGRVKQAGVLSSNRPSRWIILPKLLTTDEIIGGRLFLGQILGDPQSPSSSLLKATIPVPSDLISIQVRKPFELNSDSYEQPPWSRIKPAYASSAVRFLAERAESRIFSPDAEYVKRVLELEEVRQYAERKRNYFATRNLYMIVGTQTASAAVISDGKVAEARTDVNISPEANINTTAALSEQSSQKFDQRMMFAYALMEIKISQLGNIVFGPFEGGAFR